MSELNVGTINESISVPVASASNIDIWLSATLIPVSGTTTINSFSNAPKAGAHRAILAQGAFTLTNSANFIVDGGTQAVSIGDIIDVYAETLTKFRLFTRKLSSYTVGNTGVSYLPYVNASGRLGIGEASPASTLDVNGLITATGITVEPKVIATATYTVLDTDHIIFVNTDVSVTITLLETSPVGKEIKIARLVASTNPISVTITGAHTVEGTTTFVVWGGYTASTTNKSLVSLTKTTSTLWSFTGGEIGGSTTNGSWIKYSDGTMECWGDWLSTTGAASNQSNWYGTTSGTTYYRALTVTFPGSFLTGTTPKVVSSSATVASLETLSSSGFTNSVRHSADPVGFNVYWHAIGRWKA